jgi:hypothetical protein
MAAAISVRATVEWFLPLLMLAFGQPRPQARDLRSLAGAESTGVIFPSEALGSTV